MQAEIGATAETANHFDSPEEATLSSKPIDVTEVMRDIQARVRKRRLGASLNDIPMSIEPSVAITDGLRASLSQLQTCRQSLDSLPPRPPTLRGAAGAAFLRLLRRVLFWQYMQARSFQSVVTRSTEQLVAAIDTIVNAVHRVSSSTDRIDRQVKAVFRTVQELETRAQDSYSFIERFTELSKAHEQLRATHQKLEADNIKLVADDQDLRAANRQLTIQNGQLAAEIRSAHETITQLSRTLGELSGKLESLDRYTIQTRRNVVLQEQRLSFILSSVRQQQPLSEQHRSPKNGGSIGDPMAGLYMAFQDAFRGSREDITERLSKYLPVLEEAGLDRQADIVVDIGCGRGEWLEILSRAGYRGRGCDSNQTMVEACKGGGIDVSQQDALEFLASMPDNSVGAVTAFHVIEHLPLASLLALIDGCLRVLRPGGILIFETPNPLNVLVGCHNFHLDPTHLKPIPMQLLHFLVEARGFGDVRPMTLHPYPESMLIPEPSGCAKRFNEYFYGPQDYAVIAAKV